MCARVIYSHDFHNVIGGDKLINPIPFLRWDEFIPNIGCLDPSTCAVKKWIRMKVGNFLDGKS